LEVAFDGTAGPGAAFAVGVAVAKLDRDAANVSDANASRVKSVLGIERGAGPPNLRTAGATVNLMRTEL
jgi:hypothetical protein